MISTIQKLPYSFPIFSPLFFFLFFCSLRVLSNLKSISSVDDSIEEPTAIGSSKSLPKIVSKYFQIDCAWYLCYLFENNSIWKFTEDVFTKSRRFHCKVDLFTITSVLIYCNLSAFMVFGQQPSCVSKKYHILHYCHCKILIKVLEIMGALALGHEYNF